MKLDGVKEKSLLFFNFLLDAILIFVFAVALVFDIAIEFFRQIDFKSVLKSPNQNTLRNPFNFNKAKQK